MKKYKKVITLAMNSRGCYILDTIKGCNYAAKNVNGCYCECYASNIASRYGFDFTSTVNRSFVNEAHRSRIKTAVEKIDMPFVRIGEMGDPSCDWFHTINVCKEISPLKKKIVMVSKHFEKISDNLLSDIENLDLCINTSISALDTDYEIDYRLSQYERLKNYCNSVLRVVSCNYNKESKEGLKRSLIQKELLKNEKTIDTIFRPSTKNRLVKDGVIKVDKVMFLKTKVLASVYNNNNHFGYCYNCPDMCGINITK